LMRRGGGRRSVGRYISGYCSRIRLFPGFPWEKRTFRMEYQITLQSRTE
jgi:hypothetical protein